MPAREGWLMGAPVRAKICWSAASKLSPDADEPGIGAVGVPVEAGPPGRRLA